MKSPRATSTNSFPTPSVSLSWMLWTGNYTDGRKKRRSFHAWMWYVLSGCGIVRTDLQMKENVLSLNFRRRKVRHMAMCRMYNKRILMCLQYVSWCSKLLGLPYYGELFPGDRIRSINILVSQSLQNSLCYAIEVHYRFAIVKGPSDENVQSLRVLI